jgi:signal transduction histidine kinase/ActR/RegA family two-component response regulator
VKHLALPPAQTLTPPCQSALLELGRRLELAESADAAIETTAWSLADCFGAAWHRGCAELESADERDGCAALEPARKSGPLPSPAGSSAGSTCCTLALPIRSASAPFELLTFQRGGPFTDAERSTAELAACLLAAALRRLAALGALRDSRTQLEQSERIKCIGQLASGVAHDFNNLLTVISAAAEVMSDTLGAEHPSAAQLGLILDTSHRAAQLTRKLLAFSRKGRPAMAATNVHDVLDTVRELLVLGMDRRISLQLVRCAGPCLVLADASSLGNAILNLCLNARDAMPTGGVLRITTQRIELDAAACAAEYSSCRPGAHVHLEIHDSGTGMDAATLARVFEPFFTTKEPGRGTGLGMPIALAAVREHKGGVFIRSQLGAGTSCTLLLPLLDAAGAEAPASSPASRRKRSLRVLLVDDEPDVCLTAARLMRKLGHNVQALCSGEKALSHLRVHSLGYDVLVLDVMMPHPSGLELHRALHRDGIELPTVFMSGSSCAEHDGTPAERDGVVFLAKPFRQTELADAIARSVESFDERPSLLHAQLCAG